MTDRSELKKFIENRLADTDRYLTDLKVSGDNVIAVEIDSTGSPIDIDECVELSRAIEEAFPRDEEDYELEVGTAGLTSPFKVIGQYIKNIGNEIEVFTVDGKKYTGVLREVNEDSFEIETEEKVRHEGQKRPVLEKVNKRFKYSEVRKAQYLLRF